MASIINHDRKCRSQVIPYDTIIAIIDAESRGIRGAGARDMGTANLILSSTLSRNHIERRLLAPLLKKATVLIQR